MDIYRDTHSVTVKELQDWAMKNSIHEIQMKTTKSNRLIFTFYYGPQRVVVILDSNMSKNVLTSLSKALEQAKKDVYCAELRAKHPDNGIPSTT